MNTGSSVYGDSTGMIVTAVLLSVVLLCRRCGVLEALLTLSSRCYQLHEHVN